MKNENRAGDQQDAEYVTGGLAMLSVRGKMLREFRCVALIEKPICGQEERRKEAEIRRPEEKVQKEMGVREKGPSRGQEK